MRKTIIYLLALILLITSLSACGGTSRRATGTDVSPSQNYGRTGNGNGIISSDGTGTTVPNGDATPGAGVPGGTHSNITTTP